MRNKNVLYNSEFDYFEAIPYTKLEERCVACDNIMDVERNVESSTFSEFGCVTGSVIKDIFTCKYSGERWHDQVIELLKFKRKIPSHKISLLLDEEIKEIILNKAPTKTEWGSR